MSVSRSRSAVTRTSKCCAVVFCHGTFTDDCPPKGCGGVPPTAHSSANSSSAQAGATSALRCSPSGRLRPIANALDWGSIEREQQHQHCVYGAEWPLSTQQLGDGPTETACSLTVSGEAGAVACRRRAQSKSNSSTAKHTLHLVLGKTAVESSRLFASSTGVCWSGR